MKKLILRILIICLTFVSFEAFSQNNLEVFVWHDLNANGIQDGGESGIPAIPVPDFELWQDVDLSGDISGGDMQFAYDIEAAGVYSWNTNSLPDGDYIVRYVDLALSNWYISPLMIGGAVTDSDFIDELPNSGISTVFSLVGGVTEVDIDLGLFMAAVIESFVWQDPDYDGDQLDAIPITLATATLYNSGGGVATDLNSISPVSFSEGAGGIYRFEFLTPGDYYIEYDIPPTPGGSTGPFFSTIFNQDGDDSDSGDGDMDSDADPVTPRATRTFSVASDETINNVDAGFVLPAILEVFVWDDANFNGLQDGGELGIDGTTPALFNSGGGMATDLMGNNPAPFTAMGGGIYTFENLAPGNYYVVFDLPATPGGSVGPYFGTMFNQDGDDSDGGDTDTDSDSDPNAGTQFQTRTFTLISDMTNTKIDAGFILPATIETFVWEDLNGDGIQDGGEPGILGIPGGTFTLFDVTLGAAAVDPYGNPVMWNEVGGGVYQWLNAIPSDYHIEYVSPLNQGGVDYYLTDPDIGADDTVDSDPDKVTFTTADFTVIADQVMQDFDAGYIIPARIETYVWNDLNGDGIQDAGEAGIVGEGMNFQLWDNDLLMQAVDVFNNPINSAELGAGLYEFVNIPPGNYYIQYVLPAPPGIEPFVITVPDYSGMSMDDPFDAADDSDIYDPLLLQSHVFFIESEEFEEEVDAGFILPTRITCFVWEDNNGDGIQDAAELPIANATATLFESDGVTPAMDIMGMVPVFTPLGSFYIFDNLAPGDYIIQFDVPPSPIATPYYVTRFNEDGFNTDASDMGMDSDADPNDALRTYIIELQAEENHEIVDAGFYIPGIVGDRVFCDKNGDGLFDAVDMGEGVDNVTVTMFNTVFGEDPLLDVNGLSLQMTTDAMGNYEFRDVPPGEDHQIRFDVPMGFELTLPNVGGDELIDSDALPITPMSAETDIFELLSREEIEEAERNDCGMYQLITISGQVWLDAGMDLILTTEGGVTGVLVELLRGGSMVILDMSITFAGGTYRFEDVPPGSYVIRVAASNFAGGPLDGTESCEGVGSPITLDNDDNGEDGGPPTVTAVFELLSNCDRNTPPVVDYIDFCFDFDCDEENELASRNCDDLDVICDLPTLEGFCSRMYSTNSSGTQPSPLCPGGGTAHNISWFGFVAGSGTYSLVIDPFACGGGAGDMEGVQIGVYEGCDFAETVFCQPNCSLTAVTVPSTDLVPGETYYIFIDGCFGSVCSYTIEIAGNYSSPPTFFADDLCIGTDPVTADCNDVTRCIGVDVDFVLTGIDLEIDYTWSVTTDAGGPYTGDDNFMNTEPTVSLTFDAVGTYTLCLETATNGCQDILSPPRCRTVEIIEIDDEMFPNQFVCDGEAASFDPAVFDMLDPNMDGTLGWQAGPQAWVAGPPGAPVVNSFLVTLANGCEYMQSFELEEHAPSPVEEVFMAMCPDEIFSFNNTQYDLNSFGGDTFYEDLGQLLSVKDHNGCDSTANIRLEMLNLGGFYVVPKCTADGIGLDYTLNPYPGDWMLSYSWEGPSFTLPGDNDSDGNPATIIADQGSGVYILTITITKTLDDGSTKNCDITLGTGVVVDFSLFEASDPVISGPIEVCEGTIATYTATSTSPGVDFTWDPPSGVVTSITGSNNETIEIDWTGSTGGNIGVSAMNECGNSNPVGINVDVLPNPSGDFTVDPVVCVDSISSIVFIGNAAEVDDFTWDFDGGTINNGTGGEGPGPHNLSWTTAGVKYITMSFEDNNGCFSDETRDSVLVEAPIAAPVVTCNLAAGIGEVIFMWTDVPGASYTVDILSAASLYSGSSIDGTTFTVTGVGEGVSIEIVLTTETGTACNTLVSAPVVCTAQNCVAPLVVVTPLLAVLCEDNDTVTQQIAVVITPTPMVGNPGVTVYSGTGVDPVTGIFDASVAGVGVHAISVIYTDPDMCIGGGNTTIEVKEVPTASFTFMVDDICITDEITFMYNGTDNPTQFFWDFGDVISPDGGPMPSVGWLTAGMKTIRLTVEKNGCTSQPFEMMINVQPELEPIIVSCIDQEDTSVTFGWNTITGATSYSVVIDNGTPVTQTADTIQVVVTPLTEVSIVVTAIPDAGVLCPGLPSDTVKCIALDCPDFTFTNMTTNTIICLDGMINSIPILYTVVNTMTGMTVSGLPDYNGHPNVNPASQLFNLNGLAAGNYSIPLVYNEILNGQLTGCSVSGIINFTLLEQPSASFTITETDICVDESVLVNFDGSGLGGATPDWVISGGSIAPTVNPNEYEWTFTADGTYTLDLAIQNDICESIAMQQSVTVNVEESIGDVTCQETDMGEITIMWNAVSCATEYTIFVDGVEQATQTNTTYVADNLFDGNHDFEVQATSSCACGILPGVNSSTCSTTGCTEQIAVLSAPIQSWCINDELALVTIDVVLTGDDGSGTVTWTGGNNDGTFNPDGLSAGEYTVYYNYVETDCPPAIDSISFTLFDVPSIVAMPDNPSCFTDMEGFVSFTPSGGQDPYTILLDGNAVTAVGSIATEGAHDVEIIDANGCRGQTTFTIVVPDALDFDDSDISGEFQIQSGSNGQFSIDPIIVAGVAVDSIVWTSIDGTVYCSGAGCFSIDEKFSGADTITVVIYYNSSCQVSATFEVFAQTINVLDVVNIFTPNSDGSNDFFMIFTNDPNTIFNSVLIYDRWGNLVGADRGWQGPGAHEVWDGRFNGTPVQPGVYVYTMEYIENGVTKRRSGDITVVR